MICKIFEEMKKEQKQTSRLNKQSQFYNTVKEITKITENLKPGR